MTLTAYAASCRSPRDAIRATALGIALGGLVGISSSALAQSAVVVDGATQQREVRCTGQDVEIIGREHRVTLIGDCGVVVVQGAEHRVSLGSARRLFVDGRAHTVVASGPVGELVVEGADHDVRAEIAASAKPPEPAQVSVTGRGSSLRLRLLGATRIEAVGADQRVLWTTADGVPPPDGVTTGRGNTIRRDDGTR
jgi:hypothetical protein